MSEQGTSPLECETGVSRTATRFICSILYDVLCRRLAERLLPTVRFINRETGRGYPFPLMKRRYTFNRCGSLDRNEDLESEYCQIEVRLPPRVVYRKYILYST